MSKKVFERELSYIKNEKYRKNGQIFIDLLPDYFFLVPASSTGKYHPKFALGEGGLVRHTKVAVRIAYEMLLDESIGYMFTDDQKDLILIALMLHDGCKSGLVKGEYTVVDHPLIVAELIRKNASKTEFTEEEISLICSMIETHMGPYNKDYKGNVVLPVPQNKYQRFVHMCDLLASKKFLNVNFVENEISEE